MRIVILCTAAALSLALGDVSWAGHDVKDGFTMNTYLDACDSQVHAAGDAGTIVIRYSGYENRSLAEPLRGDKIRTRIGIRSQQPDGAWVAAVRSDWNPGHFGRTRTYTDYHSASFVWSGETNPAVGVSVPDFDVLYRATTTTRIMDATGATIATLVSHDGNCIFRQ